MYTLYTDKEETFKCKIGVEGAKISDTKARLILNSKDLNLMFEGEIKSNGECVIPIKKLKNLLDEGTTGDLKLEVIAEDTLFSPWEDKFEIKTNKKVQVEVNGGVSKPTLKEEKIKIQIVTPKASRTHGERISEVLSKKGIDLTNINKNQDRVTNIVEAYCKKFNVTETYENLIGDIIDNLSKTI